MWLDDQTISLHLPDLSRHTILLTPASNIPDEPTPCLYSGTMGQDQSSVVAVTGCKDSPETDVTIASRLVPGGLVDLVIVSGTTYNIKANTSLRRGKDSPAPAPESDYSVPRQMDADSPMPKQVVIKTHIRYDNTLLGKFEGSHTATKQWLSRVLEMVRPRLLLSSLDTGVLLQVIGGMEHIDEDIRPDNSTIYRLTINNTGIGLTSYFGYKLVEYGNYGLSFPNSACKLNGYAVNINLLHTRTQTEVSTARVWAHELGHTIGMR